MSVFLSEVRSLRTSTLYEISVDKRKKKEVKRQAEAGVSLSYKVTVKKKK